jgi:hypothetical protein
VNVVPHRATTDLNLSAVCHNDGARDEQSEPSAVTDPLLVASFNTDGSTSAEWFGPSALFEESVEHMHLFAARGGDGARHAAAPVERWLDGATPSPNEAVKKRRLRELLRQAR